jgi:2-methylisocitrate lyase-like PEP mutase family enzyme
MLSGFSTFKDLHHEKNLFILPNAWDAKSALVFEQNGFRAIGTSSAAVAASLGYEDGEEMSFDDYLFIIKRMIDCVQIPVTVDMEMGYAKTNEKIAENIERLADLGVTGINIEDSIVINSKRFLKDADEFATTVEYIKNHLSAKNLSVFINIRCDTYILDVADKQKETARRLNIYETTAANGIFLPCIIDENDIAEAVSRTRLPLNVMCVPHLPGFAKLNQLGVKRVSMGPFLFNKIYSTISDLARRIYDDKNFSSIL